MQPMSRRIVVAVGLALAVVALLYYLRTHDKPTEPRSAPAATSAGSPAPAVPAAIPSRTAPPQHVTKLANAEERQRVADRIAKAQAARHSAAPRPSLPAPETTHGSDLARVDAHVLDALAEAIPFLADCYRKALPKLASPQLTAAVTMTLTGDPDIGTLIDADQMLDQDGKPLARELDDCLRGTLNSLQLPPLAEGDKIKLQYSFTFE
jgi:hypothetical protein